jgi:hypothetical protein
LRKLQSALRDNVNTSFGRRAELVDYIVNSGAPNLLKTLGGQALKGAMPRGLARLGALGEVGAGAGAGLLGFNHAALAAAPLVVASSPRLVGEAAYGAGRAARGLNALPLRTMGRAASRPAGCPRTPTAPRKRQNEEIESDTQACWGAASSGH